MTAYHDRTNGETRGREDAARPPDPRLVAFAEYVSAYDRRDWKAGQLATRRLRALGFSVVLTKPSGPGGAA